MISINTIKINPSSKAQDELDFINSIGIFQLSYFDLLRYTSYNHNCPYCQSIDFLDIYYSRSRSTDYIVKCYICSNFLSITSFGVDLNVHFPNFIYI